MRVSAELARSRTAWMRVVGGGRREALGELLPSDCQVSGPGRPLTAAHLQLPPEEKAWPEICKRSILSFCISSCPFHTIYHREEIHLLSCLHCYLLSVNIASHFISLQPSCSLVISLQSNCSCNTALGAFIPQNCGFLS